MNYFFENKVNLIKFLKEDTYNLSDFNSITGKTFEQVLSENKGVPFDIHEKRKFIEKQEGFAGVGKVTFIHKRSVYEISAQIYDNDNTKVYVFKKLKNIKHPGMYNYACFILIKPPEKTATDDMLKASASNNNTGSSSDLFESVLNHLFEAGENNQEKDNKQNKDNSDTSKQLKKQEPEQPPEDIVYALSTMFDDKQIEEKLEILGDFISRINSLGV